MKIYFLIKLLTIHYACASMSVEDLIRVENTRLPTDNGYISINTEGPLNFLRGYFYHEYNFIQNQWAFSPEINLDYSLELTPNANGKDTYTYIRNTQNDRVYPAEKEEDKYSVDYHNAFISFLPRHSNNLPSTTPQLDPFINFLLEIPVQKDKYYILAALLLLSEGVDVSLEWEEKNDKVTKLVLKRVRGENPFFTIDISKYEREKESKEVQHDAKTFIDFFIRYKNKKSIAKSYTMEQFKKADFLDSSQFLIQAFIFYLLESVQDAERVIKAVYEILNDIILAEKEQNPKEVSSVAVFNKCFMPVSSERILYSASFMQTKTALRNREVFDIIQYYLSPVNGFRLKNDLKFSEDVQEFLEKRKYTMFLKNLLRLFSCLLFNPDDGSYSTENIKEELCPLKKFFQSYKNIHDEVTTKVCDEWYQIFQNQKNRGALRLKYLNNLRPHEKPPGLFIKAAKLVLDRDYMNVVTTEFDEEPQVGILDLLLIIAQVTDRDDIRTETSKLIDELGKEETSIDDFYRKLKIYLQDALSSLSRYKKLEIHYFNVKRQVTKTSLKQDIVADIVIYVTSLDIDVNEPYVLFFPLHSKDSGNKATMHSCTLSNSDAFGIVPMQIKERNSFIGCLLTQYVDKTIVSTITSVRKPNLSNTIKQIVRESPVNIKGLLMVPQIETIYQQDHFLLYCISYAKAAGVEFTYDSPMMRFIFNMLANLPLQFNDKRCYFLRVLVYTGIDEIVNQRLKLDRNLYLREIVHTENAIHQNVSIMKHIAETNCSKSLIEALSIATSLVKEKEGPITTIPLHQPEILIAIFSCVFEDGTMDVANHILADYEKTYPDVAISITNTIRFFWFLLACRKNSNKTLINALYDSMDIDKIAKRKEQKKYNSGLDYMVNQDFYTSFSYLHKTEEKQKVLACIEKDQKYEKLERLLDNLF